MVSNALSSRLYDHSHLDTDALSTKEWRKEISIRHTNGLQSNHNVPPRRYRGWVATRASKSTGIHGFKDKPDPAYKIDESMMPDIRGATMPIEVEKTRTMSAEQLGNMLFEGKDAIFSVNTNSGIAQSNEDADAEEAGTKEAGAKKSGSKAVRSGGPSGEGSARESKENTVSGTSPSSRKRKLDTMVVQESTESSSKWQMATEAGAEEVVNNEAQLLKYMSQVMSQTVRSYTIGLLIKDDKLWLVYGDRMGVILSRQIEFLRKDSHLLSLILAAMGFAGVHELGIHPNIHFPRVNEEDRTECEESFNPEHGYDRAILRLEGQGEDGSETLEYDFDVDEDAGRSVYTEFGLIGRGTTVIPIKRRTGTSSSEEESEELVAKVAWPRVARTGEHEYIRKVRQSLKAGGKESILRHIVDMKAALTKDSEAMGLPRHAMGLYPEGQDLRVCRILILKRYRPLDTIGSQAEFHQVFIQVVRAHYWAYTTAHVLHRDISLNNIMWYKCGDEVVGVLCDWDLAEDHSKGDKRAAVVGQSGGPEASDKRKGKSTSSRRSMRLADKASNQQKVQQQAVSEASNNSKADLKPRYRTGTGPFMAIDLLVSDPPPLHKYRHDLESFFYLYACAAATFDPDQEQTIRVIAQWNQSSFEAIGLLKRQFLRNKAEYEGILKHAPAQFQPAVKGVLRGLRFLFGEVDILTSKADLVEFRAERDDESPDVVQRKLADIEKKRDGLASYAKFMEILGVPQDEL